MAYVQIYETVIDPKSVIGVGPFMVVLPNDLMTRSFGKLAFYFELHTTGGLVRISGNPHYFQGDADERKKAEREKEYLQEIWKTVRNNLLTDWDIDAGLKSLKEQYEKAD